MSCKPPIVSKVQSINKLGLALCSSSNKFVELHNDEHWVNMRFDSDHAIKLVKHVIKRVKNHLGDIDKYEAEEEETHKKENYVIFMIVLMFFSVRLLVWFWGEAVSAARFGH